jgi:hypothetical protein
VTLYSATTITGADDNNHIIGPSGTDVSVRYSLTSQSTSKELPIGPNGSLRSITIAPTASTTTVYTAQYKVGIPSSATIDFTNHRCGMPTSSSNVSTINNDYHYDVAASPATSANLTVGFIGLDNVPATAKRYLLHWDGSKWDELSSSGTGSTVTGTAISYSPLRGMSYYRLKQTDFDGRSEIFAPITVSCRDQEIGDYSVYPNPAKEQLMIDLEIDDYQGENLKVRLMDINGKVAMEEPITLERGFNHLEMNISELPDGVYLLQFAGTKSHIKESRVVKK